MRRGSWDSADDVTYDDVRPAGECRHCRGKGATWDDYGTAALFAHGPHGEQRGCDDCGGTGCVCEHCDHGAERGDLDRSGLCLGCRADAVLP